MLTHDRRRILGDRLRIAVRVVELRGPAGPLDLVGGDRVERLDRVGGVRHIEHSHRFWLDLRGGGSATTAAATCAAATCAAATPTAATATATPTARSEERRV